LLKIGRKKSNACFALYVSESHENKRRIYVGTVGKKILKKSTDRNLLKRRIRAVFSQDKSLASGHNILIITRNGAAGLKDYASVKENIYGLLGAK